MRGKIYEEMVCDSPLELVHGGQYKIRRILIPPVNIVITLANNQVYVFRYSEDSDQRFIKEVEVSDELIKAALKFLETKEKLEELTPEIEELTK